jgi:hypothetical protein
VILEIIFINVSAVDRRLLALVGVRNRLIGIVWPATFILATADGLGTLGIMRESG